jgi:hypothetical protein
MAKSAGSGLKGRSAQKKSEDDWVAMMMIPLLSLLSCDVVEMNSSCIVRGVASKLLLVLVLLAVIIQPHNPLIVIV